MRKTAMSGHLVFACVLLTVPVIATAAVHYVDCAGGGDYLTVQAGVDAASNGDTVRLAPCVYEEHVLVSGKCLTIEGSGSDVTEIRSVGGGKALRFLDMPSPWTSHVSDLAISLIGVPPDSASVYWPFGHVEFRDCDVQGTVFGDWWDSEPYGHTSVRIYGSVIERVLVGGDGTSRIERSWIGRAHFYGVFTGGMWYLTQTLHSTDNEYDYSLRLTGATCYSTGDTMEETWLSGWTPGGDLWLEFHAEESSLGLLSNGGDSAVEIERCVLDGVFYQYYYGESGVETFPFTMSNSLVRGDVELRINWLCGGPNLGNMHLTHNTILGNLVYDGENCDAWLHHIRGNIIGGDATIGSGSCMVVTHNDVLGEFHVGTPGDSVFANTSEDPLFCDPSLDDYSLEDCSPCLGAAHDGGDVGAYGSGCGCTTSVEGSLQETSWGRIKRLFRS